MELQTLQEALKVEIQVHQVCCIIDFSHVHDVMMRISEQVHLWVLIPFKIIFKTFIQES
jgi:hypothetical protein